MVGLQQILGEDTVGDLPLREAITVESGTIVRAAVARMRDRQVGCVLILDAGGRPAGIFTERSLLSVLSQNASLDRTAVGEVLGVVSPRRVFDFLKRRHGAEPT